MPRPFPLIVLLSFSPLGKMRREREGVNHTEGCFVQHLGLLPLERRRVPSAQ